LPVDRDHTEIQPTSRTLPTPRGRRVRIIDEGYGPPVVFLHGGVGSAAEWKPVLEAWPGRHRRLAIDAYGADPGPTADPSPTIDDFADQVMAVAADIAEPLHLVGFSWGGATALRVTTIAPSMVSSLTVIEPQAYSLLPAERPEAFATITAMRDRWREHVAAGRWQEAYAGFLDHYNGPGWFASWPDRRRTTFLAQQQARGDVWDILFDSPLRPAALVNITAPTLVVEGEHTGEVDQALCGVVSRHVPTSSRVVLDGAGHLMPLTHPEALTAAILEHLSRA
jgi:lipase